MSDLLNSYRRVMPSVGARVRWACALEVVAPKVGNVHPGERFSDLVAADFLHAADALAEAISSGGRIGAQILSAVRVSRQRCESNANLGIALLLVPLAAAERTARGGAEDVRAAVQRVLERLTPADCHDVYAAIREASAGGLGTASEADVHQDAPDDLIAAMTLAPSRDSVARQYTNGFADVFDVVVPALAEEIGRVGDMLMGIRRAHLRVMHAIPDTLIARKSGVDTAEEAAARAGAALALADAQADRERSEPDAFDQATDSLDRWLREDGNQRNPGTTADLIAAGLFVLLGPHSIVS